MYVGILILLLITLLNSCLLPFLYGKIWLIIINICVLCVIAVLSLLTYKFKNISKIHKLLVIIAVSISVVNFFIATLGYAVNVITKIRARSTQVSSDHKSSRTIIKGKIFIKTYPRNVPASNAEVIFEYRDGSVDTCYTNTKGEFEYSVISESSDRKFKIYVQHIDCQPYISEVSVIPEGIMELEIFLNPR
ncbi:MAG: hypothetical protein N2555_00820 [Endomicrobia bacterium]|nr:hypothetical protein [Endomicrobiia bacterium]